MVRWMSWHCPPDTGFEIRALVITAQARYLSVKEAPHNIESLRVSEEAISCFFETWISERGKKWNESGFRPPLCTYRLNWARRTSWGWWDDWDDTVLQTQDSKFEPWRSEAEHATSRSRRLPAILTFTRGWGRNNFCFFQTAETGNWTPDSGVKGSGANHYPRAPALQSEGPNPRSPTFQAGSFNHCIRPPAIIWHRVWSEKLSLNDTKSEIRSM